MTDQATPAPGEGYPPPGPQGAPQPSDAPGPQYAYGAPASPPPYSAPGYAQPSPGAPAGYGEAPQGYGAAPQPYAGVPTDAPYASAYGQQDGAVAVAPPRRRRPVWPWILGVAVLLVFGAQTAAALYFLSDFSARSAASPELTGDELDTIDAALAAQTAVDDSIAAQRAAYQSAVADWESIQSGREAWAASNETPAVTEANPGGQPMPGNDPYGRAFLDSIGANEVNVTFDAGSGNCGYTQSRVTWPISAGGCYNSSYRNWLFLAWDPGAEDIVWPIFVHEAMHWYQNQQYYDLYLAADQAGIDYESYRHDIESDASCRAVYVYGIPIEEYVDSSSPCDVDGWYEGWLRDRITSLGVSLEAPVAENYEVVAEARP